MGFKFEPVLELGRLVYEEGTGRLIVLGGHGRAGTPDPAKYPLKDKGDYGFANHDVVRRRLLRGRKSNSYFWDGRQLYVKSA